MRERNDEAGMSLVELTVVMMLLTIVGIIVFGFLWSVLKTTTRMTNDTESEKQIELALRPMTENVRGASSISTTYPVTSSCPAGSYPTGYTNCLAMTIQRPVPNDMTCTRSVMVYGLKSDGVLREDRTDYALIGGVCSVKASYTGRPLLKNIVNGSTPLFTYFDAFGNQLNPATATQPQPFAAALTIRTSLNVQYQKSTPLLTYSSDLALRNNR